MDTKPTDVLQHYAVKIPEDVGCAALSGEPINERVGAVSLRPTNGASLGDDTIKFPSCW